MLYQIQLVTRVLFFSALVWTEIVPDRWVRWASPFEATITVQLWPILQTAVAKWPSLLQESVQILLSSLRKNRAQCLINLLTSFSFMYCSSCNKLISLFFSLGNLTWKVQSLSVQTEPLDHLVWTISDYHLAQRGRHWEVSRRLFYQCLYLP